MRSWGHPQHSKKKKYWELTITSSSSLYFFFLVLGFELSLSLPGRLEPLCQRLPM
jgi:hypothetical protein